MAKKVTVRKIVIDRKSKGVLLSILMIVVGVLFLILKAQVASIAMTVIGAMLIVFGALDLVHGRSLYGIIKAVVGVLVIVCGWTLVSAALYVIAALLLIYGIYELYALASTKTTTRKRSQMIVVYGTPILNIVLALLLLFNQGGVLDWVFIVAGILFIADGVLSFIDSF